MYKKLLAKNKIKITGLGILLISLLHLIIFNNIENKLNIYISLVQDYKKNGVIYNNDQIKNSLYFARNEIYLDVKNKFKIYKLLYSYNNNEFKIVTKSINLKKFLNYFEERISKIAHGHFIISNKQNLKITESIVNNSDINKEPKFYFYLEQIEITNIELYHLIKNKKIYFKIITNYEKANFLNNILIIFITNIFLYLIFIKIYFKK